MVWGEVSLWALPRDVSDHFLLIVKEGGWDWGPKLFRFNYHWLVNRRFMGVVEGLWRDNSVEGWMGYVLKEKLKGLKVGLKEWRNEEYRELEEKVRRLVEEIVEHDNRGEEDRLVELDVQTRKKKFAELWRLLKARGSMVVQRSRSKWLKEGDANTKFFHNCVKGRSRRNAIKGLKVG